MVSSSKLKDGPYQCAENQAKVAGGLHGQTRSFQLNSDVKRKHIRITSKTQVIQEEQRHCEHAVMGLGKPKPTWISI